MKRTPHSFLSVLIASLSLALIASTGLSGCASVKTLTGSDQAAVLAYSEPIADNLFQGLNAGDYAAFSRDFDAAMLAGIPATNFTSSLFPLINGKLGKYISRQVVSVTEIGSNLLIIYTAKFEKDNAVTVRFSLEVAAPHHVSGLYFNSPALNK